MANGDTAKEFSIVDRFSSHIGGDLVLYIASDVRCWRPFISGLYVNPPSIPPPGGTLLETDEEILQALRAGQPPAATPRPKKPSAKPTGPDTPAAFPSAVKPAAESAVRAVQPFRPTARPPAASLVVCDDGRSEGEVIRLRGDRFVIGRTEGDLLLPHDPLVSGRHIEITRQLVKGEHRWVVTDLNSMNGTFVRVSRAALADQSEILVGGGRYRLETSEKLTIEYVPAAAGSTQGYASQPAPQMPPALVELVPGGIGNRYVLAKSEYWIGTDPACPIHRPADPFCEPWHARLYLASGGWHAEHKKALNGLWLRVPQIASEKGCQFQIGEQRFRLSCEG